MKQVREKNRSVCPRVRKNRAGWGASSSTAPSRGSRLRAETRAGASVKRLMNLCRAFMSKDGSAAIYLTSEEPVRGKFIVSSGVYRGGNGSGSSLFSLRRWAGRREERWPFHKFISAVKRERGQMSTASILGHGSCWRYRRVVVHAERAMRTARVGLNLFAPYIIYIATRICVFICVCVMSPMHLLTSENIAKQRAEWEWIIFRRREIVLSLRFISVRWFVWFPREKKKQQVRNTLFTPDICTVEKRFADS